VSDQVKVLDLGRGISRTVSLSKSANNLYFRLADAENIVQSADGTFIIDNQSYYLKVEDGAGTKAFIRDSNGRKELLIPIVNTLNYSILF
jgi:hypothetical protein